ncbi:hypothetical protein O7553_02365 [Solwaraspora sp. WMMA2059]|uniref:hypothetical protein n=1 Tax=Solwaraspora sp. WMMA2059 TaxID=3015160 RepID=UPI00248D15F2|nr:hypothetical protein [Solwaraspora sp. WMMA2059]WBB97831.1 hypothetical protein O7553_02365 [Solwaraspora sp. WMMA2059]
MTSVSAVEVKSELRTLRAGRGVSAPDLSGRLGDHLRTLCGNSAVNRDDEPAELRERVIAELNSQVRRLPDDMALAARVALGLHPQAQDAHFRGRVAWLARRLGREDRTALRRINEAEVLLAEAIGQELGRRSSSPVGAGWHVAGLRVLVRLDTPTMEAYEERRIVADRDGVDEVVLGMSLPCPPGSDGLDIRADVHWGGRLIRHERPLPQRSQLVVGLPRPLAAGESCDFSVVTRLGPSQIASPHYVLTATRRCRRFELRVRFDPDRLPKWVRRVTGEPVRLLDTPQPGSELLQPDAVGEVFTDFDDPELYLAYGIQWFPALQP